LASQQSASTATKENPEVKIAKKSIREKSNNSSMVRAANVKNVPIIYKIANINGSKQQNPTISAIQSLQ
jgi:hypothetical protein